MAHPEGQPVVLGEEEARQAEERFQKLLEEVNQARETESIDGARVGHAA